MHQSFLSNQPKLEIDLEKERHRLVRLCTSWLGDSTIAEDVVQETLLEAWLKIENLRDAEAFSSWLSGIARNMTLRRLRREGHDLSVLQVSQEPAELLSNVPSPFDFEVELDRADLTHLLEQALALLPAETQTILIQKYVEETSHRAIATQLGVTENVAAVRLHRGKIALRKVLADELHAETAPFGLLTAENTWQETRIWCTCCGQRRLIGKLDETEFVLRCPTCNDEPGSFHSQSLSESHSKRFKTYRPALNHFCMLMDDLFQRAIEQHSVPCSLCGRSLPLHYTIAHYAPPSIRAKRGLHVYCHDCQSGSYETLDGLALNLAQGREFFKAHPRIHTLPQREIEHNGRPSVVVSFASVSDNATYDVILQRDTYETVAVYSSDE